MEQSINAVRNAFTAFADMHRAHFETRAADVVPVDASAVENDLRILREWNATNQAATISSV